MTSVLEPRSSSTDVVGSALTVHLDQHHGIFNVLAIPGFKGRQQLETVAVKIYNVCYHVRVCTADTSSNAYKIR